MANFNLRAYEAAYPDLQNFRKEGVDFAEAYREHYATTGQFPEGNNPPRTDQEKYKSALAGLSDFEKILGDIEGTSGISADTRQDLLDAAANKEFGGGMTKAELEDFETLVSRLEKSKKSQAGQANRARQRDIMAGGLASMMTNF